jgi:uncharacterized membrane protein YphA (DoxX/SURF4 family)
VSKALSVLLRLGLAVVFVWAAVTKVRAPADFAQSIANYRMLPASVVPWTAATLPGIEIVVGLALVLPLRRWARPAAIVALGMLAVFAVAIAASLARGINIDCGCFGSSGQPATWWTFGRDVALIAAAGFVAWRTRA